MRTMNHAMIIEVSSDSEEIAASTLDSADLKLYFNKNINDKNKEEVRIFLTDM